MHFFTDYIQPLTFWLREHPHVALLATFIISFTESLAIIGSIIPGSVTMTAIGILAGSGIMRIDLTFLAAILGAVGGDGASYLLGYYYSDRLLHVWPFRRYPNWLAYGKDYFARHGGKSVLIGRFVGPLRSIIPVIAGMMRMSKWRFLSANVVSGIFWSILYVLPGVLIGTASSELSPEIATRLFILVLLALIALWLLSLALNWLFIRINRALRLGLHSFWLRLSKQSRLASVLHFVTPDNEANHYPTAAFYILFLLSTGLFCLLVWQVFYQIGIAQLNQPIFLFLQSLRTYSFDVFFTAISQLVSPLTLGTLIAIVVALTLYYRDQRTLAYWLSLNMTCALFLMLMHLLIPSTEPQGFLDFKQNRSFPIPELLFATTLYVSFALYLNAYCLIRYKHTLKITLLLSLLLTGFSFLYLGEHWFTDLMGAYLCGLSISFGHWLFYRRIMPTKPLPNVSIAIIMVLLITSVISGLVYFQKQMHEHQPYYAQYLINDKQWWNQKKPLLPIYRTNRIGKPISLFNIQYVGPIAELEQALNLYGWQTENDSFFSSVLKRIGKEQNIAELPIISQLYLNRKPILVMTYTPNRGYPIQVLRIWRSNYHFTNDRQPIWIGSVHPLLLPRPKFSKPTKTMNSLFFVKDALSSFSLHSVSLPSRVMMQALPTKVTPDLLLIRKK